MAKGTEKIDATKAVAAVDEAYQLGFMEGFKTAKQQAAAEQQAIAEEQAMANGEMGGQGPESLARPIAGSEASAVSQDSASLEAPQQAPPGVAEEGAGGGELMSATDELIDLMSKVEIPEDQKILRKSHESMLESAKKLKEIGIKTLNKSVKSLPVSKRRIIHQQDAVVEKVINQWNEESEKALKSIIAMADKHKEPKVPKNE